MSADSGLPTIYPGMRVEVSQDETFSTPHFGTICSTNNGRPHIIATIIDEDGANPAWPFADCIHQNDPDLQSCKEAIRQSEVRGVYRLAMPEIQAQNTVSALNRLENVVEDLQERLQQQAEISEDLRMRAELLETVAAKTGAIKPVRQRA